MTQQRWTVSANSPSMIAPFPNGWPIPMMLTNTSTDDQVIYLGVDAQTNTTNGTPIPPGGSVQWSPNTPCFAVADVANADLRALDRATGLFNPYAIAQSISGIGVPSINESVLLYDGSAAAFPNTDGLDVSRYQSVIGYVEADSGTPAYTGSLRFVQLPRDPSVLNNFISTAITGTQDAGLIGPGGITLGIARIPVVGERLYIYDTYTDDVNIKVYGTYRNVSVKVWNQQLESTIDFNLTPDENGGYLSGIITVPAATTWNYPVEITASGKVKFVVTQDSTPTVGAFYILRTAANVMFRRQFLPADTGRSSEIYEFEHSGVPFIVTLVNSDAAARQFRCALYFEPDWAWPL